MRALWWLLPAVLLAAGPARAEEPPVVLPPGGQRVLELPGLRRVAVADPSVVEVKVVGGQQLLLIAGRRGRTSLTLWTGSQPLQRTVVVELPRAEELSQQLAGFGFSSLEVRTVGEHLVVDGQVQSPDEMKTLRHLLGGAPHIKLLVRLDAKVVQAALADTAGQINAALQRHGIPSARAVVVGQRILLEGSVTDEAERDKAQRIADAHYAALRDALGPH